MAKNKKIHVKPTPVEKLLFPLQDFLQREASSGILLLGSTLIALLWANSAWGESYIALWSNQLSVGYGNFELSKDLLHWINDGLMAIFFFVVGLEIKREILIGELASFRKAILPVAAAVGGMAVPSLSYTLLNPGIRGWGIPMATDIAFALGVLSLLGRRVPFSVKVFLLALAIADDIGAIVVIAVFYTSYLDVEALTLAVLLLLGVFALNRAGVRNIHVYVMVGVMLWLAVFESGIHATLTGVALGLLTPAAQFYDPRGFTGAGHTLMERFAVALEASCGLHLTLGVQSHA